MASIDLSNISGAVSSDVSGNISVVGVIRGAGGTPGAPTYSSIVDSTTGVYFSAAATINLAIAGVNGLEIINQGNNIRFQNKFGVSGGNGFFFYAGNGGLAASLDASSGFVQRAGGISASGTSSMNAPTGGVNWIGADSGHSTTGSLYGTSQITAALSGATVSLAAAIPAGAIVLGVATRVTTAITGATSYSVGDGTVATAYGSALAIALGTTSDNTNWTLTSPKIYPAATAIVLTANGSNFTGGVVRVVVYYANCTAPTS